MTDRRRKLTFAFVLFVALLGAGIVYNGPWKLPEFPHDPPSEQTVKPGDSTAESVVGELTDALAPSPSGANSTSDPAIDVARIAKDGTSVIAGRAEPNSAVTLLEDGKPVAIAKADDSGSWSLTTEHKFSSGDSQLTVKPGEDEGLRKAAEEAVLAARTPAPEAPSGKETATERLMHNLEDMVAAAREEADKQISKAETGSGTPPPEAAPPVPQVESSVARTPAAPEDEAAPPVQAEAPPTAIIQAPAAPQPAAPPTIPSPDASSSPMPASIPEVKPAVPAAPAAPKTAAADEPLPRPASPAPTLAPATAEPAPKPVAIPIPITFVYRETEFTPVGKRAAELLLEYLRLKNFDRISLSGHADERGSLDFNMELSEDRLAAVEHFLRSGGYTGKLDLLAMGETEPFRGVDRKRTPREELLQLDRRVELRVSR